MQRFARFAVLAVAVLALTSGFTAIAAEPEHAPPPNVIAAPASASSLFAGLLSPSTIAEVAFAALGMVLGGKAIASAVWKRRIALIIYHSFHAAEDGAAETDGEDAFDKAAFALKWADDYCLAHGWRPLKPEEQALIKLGYQSVHGQQIAAAKVTARAVELVRDDSPSSPSSPSTFAVETSATVTTEATPSPQ